MLIVTVAITSCIDDKDDPYTQRATSNFTFNLNVPDAGQTRAVSVSRYIIEVYKTSDLSTRIQRVEQNNGTIVVPLEGSIAYTCLFWADGVTPHDNATGVYNASDLQNVTLNDNQDIGDAFFGRLNITNFASTFNVTLTRATSRVNIVETDAVAASTDLKIDYEQFPRFNTYSAEAFGDKVSESKIFNSTTTTGTLGTLLTFASTAGSLITFKSTYNSVTINTVLNVPLKANHITNIRGKYATSPGSFVFIIQVDDTWQSVFLGADINLASTTAPNWISVADRNALKGGVNGAVTEITDYGYYYLWSNFSNDALNADKAYRACFDFGEGNGFWRLPTVTEWTLITGNGGVQHGENANRKLKYDSGEWRLYDERIPNQTTKFVIFPMGGLNTTTSSSVPNIGEGVEGTYWTSTATYRLGLYIGGQSNMYTNSSIANWGMNVRCVRSLAR